MKRSTFHRLVMAFFGLYALAVTWPVVTLFKDPLPLIFGFPLPLAWSIAWILLGFVVLVILNWFEERR